MKKFLLTIALLLVTAIGAQAQGQCVRLQEIDGSPNVGCVSTIKVTNGTLSCTGNVCTLTISGGGGGSPGGADTNVQYNDSGSFGGVAGFIFDKTSKISLGVAGTSVGAIGFRNATSGTITLQPVTGALGTVTLSLPAATDTLVGKATTDTLTNKTINGASNTLTVRIANDVSGLGTGVATFLGTPSSANLASALTDETGTGAAVFANTPTLVTPVLGAATGTSIVLTGNYQTGTTGFYKFGSLNALGYTDGTGPKFTDANTGNTITFNVQSLSTDRTVTWPNAAGTVTLLGNTSTGSGSVVLATSPTLVTPALGTPSSVTLTNATGLPPTTGISGWPANSSGVLTNDGAGNLSWGAGGGGITVGTTAIASGTATRLVYETSGNKFGRVS